MSNLLYQECPDNPHRSAVLEIEAALDTVNELTRVLSHIGHHSRSPSSCHEARRSISTALTEARKTLYAELASKKDLRDEIDHAWCLKQAGQ